MKIPKQFQVSGFAAGLAFTLVSSAASAATVFSDGTFNPADYTLSSYAGAAVSTSVGQTVSGNPGTGLQGSYGAQGGNTSGVLFTAINSSFVYNPGTSGAIGSLSASLDRFFQPTVNSIPIAVGSYSLRILAQQDGKIYQSIFTFGPFNQPGGTWYTLSKSDIKASDFKLFDPLNFAAAGTQTGLDFAGDAITFGFAMRAAGAVDSNGDPIDLPSAGVLRADNFNLAISAVPETSTWVMAIIGFVALGSALRLRKDKRGASLAV